MSHVDLNDLYEYKIKKIILYLVDKIEWPKFYEQLVKIMDMWNEIKGGKDSLKPIMSNWGRDKEITL